MRLRRIFPIYITYVIYVLYLRFKKLVTHRAPAKLVRRRLSTFSSQLTDDGSSADGPAILCRDDLGHYREHFNRLLARCLLSTNHRELSASVRRRIVSLVSGDMARRRCLQCTRRNITACTADNDHSRLILYPLDWQSVDVRYASGYNLDCASALLSEIPVPQKKAVVPFSWTISSISCNPTSQPR